MCSATSNFYQHFTDTTKTYQQEAFESAIAKANEAIKNANEIKISTISRKICEEAFKIFKKNMVASFSDPTYESLLELTLLSRQKIFFIDLKEKVKEVLSTSKCK